MKEVLTRWLTKLVPRGAKVLVNFSGSASDVCLLSMTKLGVEDFLFKKLCVDLEAVYVDIACINSIDTNERFKEIQSMREILAQFNGIKCHYASVGDPENLLCLDAISKEDVSALLEHENSYLKSFNALQSLTSKQDFIRTTQAECLRKIAPKLDCGFTFISDISEIMAKRLISAMSLGRGSSVAPALPLPQKAIRIQPDPQQPQPQQPVRRIAQDYPMRIYCLDLSSIFNNGDDKLKRRLSIRWLTLRRDGLFYNAPELRAFATFTRLDNGIALIGGVKRIQSEDEETIYEATNEVYMLKY